VNGCRYCTSILKSPKTAGAEGWGMAHEELMDMLRGESEPKNEMERACFDLRPILPARDTGILRADGIGPLCVGDPGKDRLTIGPQDAILPHNGMVIS